MSNLYGEIVMWAGEFTDKSVARLDELGFLPCDGRLVDANKYRLLAEVVGTRFQRGDETTPGQFRLPDFQGRAPIGAGEGKGLSIRKLGSSIGAETHQLSVSEMPSHSHSVASWRGNDGNRAGHQDALYGQQGGGSGPAGNDQPHNNMQPSLVVNFVIRFRV